jgi:hypothetical protein
MKLPTPTPPLHSLASAAARSVQGALCGALLLGATVVAPPDALAATDGAAIGKCLLRKCQCAPRRPQPRRPLARARRSLAPTAASRPLAGCRSRAA